MEEEEDEAVTDEPVFSGEDIQLEEEKSGKTVKVSGIKMRNIRDESDMLSEDEDDEFAEVIEPEPIDEMCEVAKKLDPDYQDYYMWEKPLSSMQVTIVSFENNPNVRNHIIVCGVPSSIKSFIKPLRAKYLGEQ